MVSSYHNRIPMELFIAWFFSPAHFVIITWTAAIDNSKMTIDHMFLELNIIVNSRNDSLCAHCSITASIVSRRKNPLLVVITFTFFSATTNILVNYYDEYWPHIKKSWNTRKSVENGHKRIKSTSFALYFVSVLQLTSHTRMYKKKNVWFICIKCLFFFVFILLWQSHSV